MSAGRTTGEVLVGAAVLAVAAGFLVFAADSTKIGAQSTYDLVANFRKADGVAIGGDVRISGIKVGTVRNVALNPDTYEAKLDLSIRDDVKIPEDSSAMITSDGLLGGAYIAIQPGGSDFMLEAGDVFAATQGSINILDLVGKAISGGVGSQ